MGTERYSWYLVEEGGRLTAVDAGLPGFASTLTADLASIGHSPKDVEAVVLTHADADHTGVAAALRRAGARVLVHTDDEGALARPGLKGGDAAPVRLVRDLWRPTLWGFSAEGVRAGIHRPAPIEGAETFGDVAQLDVPGRLRAVHTPGHTPGHCVFLHEEAGALFAGDALCTLSPVTGRRGPQLMPAAMNASNEGARAALAAVEPLEADVLLPGHGEPWWGSPAAAVARARAL